ncbi:E3 ubiquitin-protein ligase RFWD3-like isoform X2 [Prunus dulcis]|uniref:E3 ubiquitin-protein ligase RFWD3-like isoform X2 n=1 Tax=Prunus dulcis TaxID=3755 RepID=UPI001482E2C6|nr:E3 ubiquitin-protein ligase RFWD3-like isoform X2 [Prunus dulcis]
MSISEPSDSVVAMLIDGEEEQEEQQQTDGRTPMPERQEILPSSQSSNKRDEGEEGTRKRVFSVSNSEGFFCPICMESWSSQGDHQVSCLPCGHVYGMSCISKWIQQCGGTSAKCPQCNTKYKLKDIIKLYASPVVVLDESLQKKVKSLDAEVVSLKTERASLLDIQDDLFSVQQNLIKELSNLREKPCCGDDAPLGETGMEPFSFTSAKGNQGQGAQWDHYFAHNFGRQGILHWKFQLQGQAWSCSWDLNSPHHIYAGLQNGMLLMFDMRHSQTPLHSFVGPTPRPIHTIHSLRQNRAFSHRTQKLLTASSSGPCVWNIGSPSERPFLVPGSEDQGACVSVAYSPSTDDIVASYRPKTETSSETGGSQVLIKRVAGCFYHKIGSVPVHLSDFHLTKSAMVDIPNCYPLFAYGDEVTRGLKLRELPSLKMSQNCEPHQHPILDVKYARSQGKGLLGCLSEDKLQLFSGEV